MLRRSIAVLLVFTLFFFGSPRSANIERADAVVVAVAPGIAIGVVELMIIACAAAAAIGVISVQQNESYQRELNQMIDSIVAATRRGAEEAGRAVTAALARMAAINGTLGIAAIGCSLLKSAVTGSSAKTREARASTVGECDPSLRASPYDCCGDFMKKFESGRMSQVGRFAYRVRYFARHSVTRECCFEWDSLHGRFEVYQRGNHQPIVHRGEKACAREEDLDDEICSATFTDKADFLSDRHMPRNGCP